MHNLKQGQLVAHILIDTDFREIDSIITSLKSNCAVDYDDIPVLVIKSTRHMLNTSHYTT